MQIVYEGRRQFAWSVKTIFLEKLETDNKNEMSNREKGNDQ